MSEANNNNYGDDQPLSEETREDLRRMTLGLTNQKTIDTLTRVGNMAKFKRQSLRALREDDTVCFEAEKEAAAEKKTNIGQKTTTVGEHAVKDHVSQDDVNDGGTEPGKGKDKEKKQI
ncbi:hypothetical protein FSPOR_1477 [Fusarium sporotrichioides]|uniref:Uncharacterized protein n=1 Tax=Fusarium sporotrichioides TaxID=5514 RepID=A0A395SQ55_FUSSP|nr:hypothetical protein FSPOR_1477 [Fusarium sporotrichioides]